MFMSKNQSFTLCHTSNDAENMPNVCSIPIQTRSELGCGEQQISYIHSITYVWKEWSLYLGCHQDCDTEPLLHCQLLWHLVWWWWMDWDHRDHLQMWFWESPCSELLRKHLKFRENLSSLVQSVSKEVCPLDLLHYRKKSNYLQHRSAH